MVAAALIGLAAACLGLVAFSAEGDAAKGGKKPPLRLGLVDPVFLSADPAERALWLDRAAAAGTDVIRLGAGWRGIVTAQPPADPTNPADPAYDFDRLDAAVRDAAARGFQIVITITGAPAWAEGPNRDPAALAGSWKPSPDRLAEFARAIATRYSGHFGDLPRVSFWEIWTEPNLCSQHLCPQAEGGKLVGPQILRALVNAASRAIHDVNGSNKVIAGGTAPFGDRPTIDKRTPPLIFWREFFCLRANLKPQKKCKGGKPRVDGFGHNPLAGLAANENLPTLGPTDHAAYPTDILVPDMHKLYDVLQAAQKHRTVKPPRGTELWVAELVWETNPPDSGVKGVSLDTQAAYLAQSLQLLRKQGVREVHWVRLRDDAPNPDFASTLQSGLYFHDGTPKPALQAFHSP